MRRVLKSVAAFVWMVFVFIVGWQIVGYITVDGVYQPERFTGHEFNNQDNIDILFAGASHIFFGVDPYELEDKLGQTVFLASTSNQEMDGTLAFVREAFRKYHPKKVFVDLSSSIAVESGVYKDRESLVSTYLVSDYLENSWNKIDYLLNASEPKHYLNSFFVTRRQPSKAFDFENVSAVIRKKSTPAYRDYIYGEKYFFNRRYAGKGRIDTERGSVEPHQYFKYAPTVIDLERISDDWKNSLYEIAELCKSNDAELVLIIIPVSNYYISASGDYDSYHAYVQDIADDLSVEFIDFNLLKETSFDTCYKNFFNEDHMCNSGRDAFTKLLYQWMCGELQEEDFHATLKEKMDLAQPDLYGLCYTNSGDHMDYRVVVNKSEQIMIRISVDPYEGEEYEVQDFCSNTCFEVPVKNLGEVTVEWYLKDDPENVNSVRFSQVKM